MQASIGDFDRMVKATYPRVFNYALRLSRNREDAADVTQETFARAYKARERVVTDRKPDSWLFQIAYRCFLDTRRRLKCRPDATSIEALCAEQGRFDPPDSAADPERAFLLGQLSDPMARALAALSAEQRALVQLAYIGELSHEELSEVFGCGAATIKTRIHRARLALKRHLASLGLDSAVGCRLGSG
jgi:RNA polymerase sigma-70 factor (ECF subfamily)